MKTLWQDSRYAARMLLKTPGFTFVAVLALALGIAANTTIFSAINALLLEPFAFRDMNRIVNIFETVPSTGADFNSIAPADFLDIKNQSTSFERLAASTNWAVNLTDSERPERIAGAIVSSEFFDVLGVEMKLGRAFAPEDDRAGGEGKIVISDNLWRRRFAADTGIIGRTVRVNDANAVVVGVAPPEVTYPRGEVEMWRPFAFEDKDVRDRSDHYLRVVGRLKNEISIQAAQAELNNVAKLLAAEHSETNTGKGLRVLTLTEFETRGARPYLLIMFGASGFLLLLACANVANLLLLRAAGRKREIAVRTALGASRWRVVRQLLTESVLLSLVGGAAGLLMSVWSIEALRAGLPANFARLVPGWSNLHLDWTVFGFTLVLSLATGIIFGFAPALTISKTNLNESLKEGGRTGGTQGRGRNRTRNILVVSEITLSFVLLVGAGLMVRSFLAIANVNPGFNSDNLLTFQVALPIAKYKEAGQRAEFYRQLTQRLQTLPGVTSAAAIRNIPLGFNSSDVSFSRVDRELTANDTVPNAEFDIITPDYFKTMEIPLLEGRAFDARDTSDKPPVVLINRKLARKFFSGENPLGKGLHLGDDARTFEIVGIVGDVLHEPFTDRGDEGFEPELAVYRPHTQNASNLMVVVIRTAGDPAAFTALAQRELQAIDKDQPMHNVQTMRQTFNESMAPQRLSSFMFAASAVVALLLAAVGIYAVIAFSVAQRTHEIGIRLALGAQRADILRLIVGQGMKLIIVGILTGLLAAFAVTRLMASILIGVSTSDFITFGGISLFLTSVALIACYVPSRGATKVDPMIALRYE